MFKESWVCFIISNVYSNKSVFFIHMQCYFCLRLLVALLFCISQGKPSHKFVTTLICPVANKKNQVANATVLDAILSPVLISISIFGCFSVDYRQKRVKKCGFSYGKNALAWTGENKPKTLVWVKIFRFIFI